MAGVEVLRDSGNDKGCCYASYCTCGPATCCADECCCRAHTALDDDPLLLRGDVVKVDIPPEADRNPLNVAGTGSWTRRFPDRLLRELVTQIQERVQECFSFNRGEISCCGDLIQLTCYRRASRLYVWAVRSLGHHLGGTQPRWGAAWLLPVSATQNDKARAAATPRDLIMVISPLVLI